MDPGNNHQLLLPATFLHLASSRASQLKSTGSHPRPCSMNMCCRALLLSKVPSCNWLCVFSIPKPATITWGRLKALMPRAPSCRLSRCHLSPFHICLWWEGCLRWAPDTRTLGVSPQHQVTGMHGRFPNCQSRSCDRS